MQLTAPFDVIEFEYGIVDHVGRLLAVFETVVESEAPTGIIRAIVAGERVGFVPVDVMGSVRRSASCDDKICRSVRGRLRGCCRWIWSDGVVGNKRTRRLFWLGFSLHLHRINLRRTVHPICHDALHATIDIVS